MEFDNRDWDLIAMVGSGFGLDYSAGVTPGTIAAPGTDEVWRERQSAFLTWLLAR